MQSIRFIQKEDRRIVVCLVLLTVILGTLYSIYLGSKLIYPDEEQYYALARNIVQLHRFTLDGVQPGAYRPPGYPLIMAALVVLGAGVVALRILNFIALALCILVVYDILKKQRLTLAPVIGAVIVFCYPVFFYTAGTLYPQVIASLMLLLIIRIMVKANTTTADFVLAGVIYGLLMLTVPSFLSTLFVTVLWLWAVDKQNRIKTAAAMVIPALLITMAWSARNYMVFDKFVFVSANSGLNLILGNSANTRPNSGYDVDISGYTAVADKMNDVDRDAYLMNGAVEYIRSHKARTAGMYGLKVMNYFNYRNEIATKNAGSSKADLLMLLTYGPLLLLFIVRLAYWRKFQFTALESLLIALYLSNAFFAAVFFTRIRFRIPYDFLLILIVAVFLDRLITAGKQEETEVKIGEGVQVQT